MSIHLVGGGLFAASEAAGPFLAEATARSAAVGRSAPRIGLLSVADASGASPSSTADIASVFGDAAEVLVTEVQPGQPFDTSVLSDIDALVVGGGRTPDYLDAVLPLVDQIRLLVSDGLPYLGYSAGAMIAAAEPSSAAGASAVSRSADRTRPRDSTRWSSARGSGSST
jgi:cyanophycinase